MEGTNDRPEGTNIAGSQPHSGQLRALAWQMLAWTVLVGVLWTLDTLTKMADRERTGVGPGDFQLITEQMTSAIGVLVMIGFVVWWLQHFPVQKSRPLSSIAGQVIGSVIFSVGHYTILFGLRRLIYAVADIDAALPQSLLANLVFEYQKDIKIYIGIVVIILLYKTYVSKQSAEPAMVTGRKKLLLQTSQGEAVLDYDQLDYFESARNYVSVFSSGREYLTRNTMNGLLESIADDRFVRTHRSFAVNLDKVEEIRTVDSSYVVRMQDGREIPLSRGYREALRDRIAGRPN